MYRWISKIYKIRSIRYDQRINKVFITSLSLENFDKVSKVLSNFICNKKNIPESIETFFLASFENPRVSKQVFRSTIESMIFIEVCSVRESIKCAKIRNFNRIKEEKGRKKNELASLEIEEPIAKRWSGV